MPTNTLPNMTMKAAGFTPAAFQGISFTPQTEDVNILANSLSKMEARQEKAAEKKSAVDTALAKIESQLHNDETTQLWFQNYKDSIQSQIQNEINAGDYGSAIKVATGLADKVMLDPSVQGRLKAEEKYQQEVKTQQARRDKGEISQNTYDWWIHSNPYKYEDTYDKNGNIIGGTDYTADFRPVADINWAAQAQAAFKMITPDKNSTSKESSTSRASSTDGTGSSKANSSQSTHKYERVKKEDILKNIENLLSATSDGYRQAEQAFDVATYETDKMEQQYKDLIAKNPNSDEAKNLKQKLDQRHQLMYRNGSPIDYKEYYARMITDNMYAEGLAYDWRTDATGSSSSKSNTTNTNSSGSGGSGSTLQTPGSRYNYNTGLWEGPMVQQNVDNTRAQQTVTSSQSNILNRFGGR